MKRETPTIDVETEILNSEAKTYNHDYPSHQNSPEYTNWFCSTHRSLIPNYNLKRTLFVYFYHRENIAHYNQKYPLSAFELKVLKKFLIKKLIQDKRKFKIMNIQNLNQDNYAEFLRNNPAVYRKNIIKSKLFKKVIKMMKSQISDFDTRYLSSTNDLNTEIFNSLDPKKAYNLMTNKFYHLCFSNEVFKTDFLRLICDPAVIKSFISESKTKFARKIDGWIDVLTQNLSDLCSVDEQASLKVRLNSSRDEIEEARLCFISIASNRSCSYDS
jgi:hypothetical protein